MRALAVAAILALIAAPATSIPTQRLEAELSWREGFAVGRIALDGPVWALQLPIEPHLPAPQAAMFLLEAAQIDIDAAYHDYVGSPQGMAQRDTQVNHETTTVIDGRLVLSAAGAEAGFLLANDGSTPAQLHLQSSAVLARSEDAMRLDLFPEFPGAPPYDLQRSTSLPSAALRAASDALLEAVVVEGEFLVHIWDMDLEDTSEGRVYRSGTERFNGIGQTDATPDGAAYEARRQVLALTVRDGRLSVAIPGRDLQAHVDPVGTKMASEGSWDLTEARGSLRLNGERHEVDGRDVHLQGSFETRFTGADGSVGSQWAGAAAEAGAARESFVAGSPAATVARGTFPIWPLLVGAFVVASGGMLGAYAMHRTRLRRSGAAPSATEMTLAPPPHGEDAAFEADHLMTKSIDLLQRGRADEVIDALAPGYDATEPVAAIKAYLLSLAHLKQGARDEGVRWILRAVELYPEFAHEVQVNDAFAAVRNDPRLRAFTDQEGVTGYV